MNEQLGFNFGDSVEEEPVKDKLTEMAERVIRLNQSGQLPNVAILSVMKNENIPQADLLEYHGKISAKVNELLGPRKQNTTGLRIIKKTGSGPDFDPTRDSKIRQSGDDSFR